MKIGMSWHYDETTPDIWSTPLGFSKCLVKNGHEVFNFGYNPQNCDFTKLIDASKNFDLILLFTAGPSDSLDKEIFRLKQNVKIPIFLEAGDDLPNSPYHHNRIKNVDAIFTPDLRCHINYLKNKLNSHWMPSWCDTEIFYDNLKPRENKCITTCGERQHAKILQDIFGNKFINKRVWNYENTNFFNSGTIVYQYARYDEITRRIFEAGGCRCAIITNRISASTGIYNLFVEDQDICYFSNEQELLIKMQKLFNDEEYRIKLSNNIYNKIQKYHLIDHRVEKILKVYKELKCLV
mgnify:CR=1 FL=1